MEELIGKKGNLKVRKNKKNIIEIFFSILLYMTGFIYMIKNDEGQIYIGATQRKKLSQRMAENRYNKLKENRSNFSSSIVLDGTNPKIIEVDSFENLTKAELSQLERHYIVDIYPDCVNKIKPKEINQYYHCDCGSIIVQKSKSRHMRSKKHINHINHNNNINN